MQQKQYKFKGTLIQAGGGTFVEFPYSVEEEFGKKGQIKIKCTIDGEPYRGSLANMGTGCHILIVLKAIREKIKKETGDQVEVVLEQDLEERKIETPPDLQLELDKHASATEFFNKLSYSHQREYVLWIESAKKIETRSNRIEKTIQMLLNSQKLK